MLLIEKTEIKGTKERTVERQKDDSLLVRFKLMSAEQENENNRIYPRPVLKKAVEDLRARLTQRKNVFAALGHKDDGMELDDVASTLEDIEMTGDDVYATSRILPTAKGKNLLTIIKHGGSVGVSSRGKGEMDGNRVKSFELLGFDWTPDPGFSTFVGRSNIVECRIPDPPKRRKGPGIFEIKISEEAIEKRFNVAKLMGYRGSLEAYKRTLDPAHQRLRTKYNLAREAGYRGTFDDYKTKVAKKS